MGKLWWTSWAPRLNKPTVSVDVKQHFNPKLSKTFKDCEPCLTATVLTAIHRAASHPCKPVALVPFQSLQLVEGVGPSRDVYQPQNCRVQGVCADLYHVGLVRQPCTPAPDKHTPKLIRTRVEEHHLHWLLNVDGCT